MKCKSGKKFLAVLAAFFLGTVNNVVKAADESEIKNIIGIGVNFDFLNFQTGMEDNLKTFAGIAKDDNKQKYTGQGWNFGVEGTLNYDLYFCLFPQNIILNNINLYLFLYYSFSFFNLFFYY